MTSRNKVLVVDDEVQVRNITELMLAQFGFEVITARDGHDALEILDQRVEEVGLVLMDLSMPRLSGVETFSRMRESHPGLGVVFTSGYDASEVESSLDADGVHGFLKKPFDLETLLSTVRRVLAPGSTSPRPPG